MLHFSWARLSKEIIQISKLLISCLKLRLCKYSRKEEGRDGAYTLDLDGKSSALPVPISIFSTAPAASVSEVLAHHMALLSML